MISGRISKIVGEEDETVKVLVITRALAQFATTDAKFCEIAKRGVNLTVASPTRWAGTDRELRDVKGIGYEVLLHKCSFSGTRSDRVGNHLYFYPWISRVIGREKWDLVHIDEEPFNLATYLALRACRKHCVPTIFATYQNINKNYPPPFNLFESYVFENASGAIAFNQEALSLLHLRGFKKTAAYIPPGVDARVFCKQDARGLRRDLAANGLFVIGFMGRIHHDKGLDTLVKTLTLLPKDSMLVLVGRGPDQAHLETVINRLRLENRVHWVPWVDSCQVAEYMSAFDVLVLPSRTCPNWKEQFGRVLVETMSCETCVVGSDSGDIPNVIGDAGLIFHEGDERELAGHLRRLMDDHSLRENLGRRGRQRVLERFAYEKIARDSVDFYEQICSGVSRMSALAV
jgi:glycosyltransferase involved in cell wall biosynthesis